MPFQHLTVTLSASRDSSVGRAWSHRVDWYNSVGPVFDLDEPSIKEEVVDSEEGEILAETTKIDRPWM